MRALAALSLLLLVTACDFSSEPSGPVDAANLSPMGAREQALMIGAQSAQQQGNLAAAEQDYLSAVGESKGHVEAHVALAKLYLAEKQPDKARAILDRARVLQPDHPGVNYLLGKLDLATGNNEAALDDFNRGLRTVPGDFDLSNGAGIASDMLGRHRAAQAIYLGLIAHHKGENLTGVRTNLGLSYLFTNEPKKAIPVLRKVTDKPDAPLVTRSNLALAYGLEGKTFEAKLALHNEVDEETRRAALARLKAYIADSSPDKRPVNVNPVVAPERER